jgi:hypothetical protein
VAAAVAVLLLLLTGAVVVWHPWDRGPGSSGLPWASGGSDDRGIASFERWRGRPADVRVMWNNSDTWANAERNYVLQEAAEQGEERQVSYGVPLLTAEDGQDLNACAAGENDEHFRVMAQGVVDTGFGDAIVRPGWEGSAGWYPWGVTAARNTADAADAEQVDAAEDAFRACFTRLATVFREVAPDTRLELNYGVGVGGTTNIADVYPGDEHVDIVANDVYLGAGVTSAQAWTDACWAGTAQRPVGLCRLAQFAREHGKRFAVPEWGVDNSNAPDADRVAYVEGMVALFADSTDVLAYEAYYNRTNDPDDPCQYRLDEGCNPDAAEAYLRLLGPEAAVLG